MNKEHVFWHDKPFSEEEAKQKLDNYQFHENEVNQVVNEWKKDHTERNTPLSKRLYDIRNKAIDTYAVDDSQQTNQLLQCVVDQTITDIIVMLDGSGLRKQFQISEYETELDSSKSTIKVHTRPITENLLKNYFDLVNGKWD